MLTPERKGVWMFTVNRLVHLFFLFKIRGINFFFEISALQATMILVTCKSLIGLFPVDLADRVAARIINL